MKREIKRRYPIGAELIGENETHFRVWAPKARKIDIVISGKAHALEREADGYFSGAIAARAGDRYGFRIDESEKIYPDPISRWQPDGPHELSAIVDPTQFQWTDAQWRGRLLKGQIVYEMHIGTFTREGTWRAAAAELAELARIGVTVIEMMPVSDFPGRFGWGYDGVDFFAPTHQYGTPEDLRYFVDQAHSLGLSVILDVVYNHFGPEGNYLRMFAEDYFTDRHANDWGDALNFDGANAKPVREFFLTNVRYWIEEFHFDGYRFDATQDINDDSPEHILAEMSRAAHDAAHGRDIILVAENEPQETRLVRPASENGYALDGLWNDDFHHTAIVQLTGRAEAYYMDYTGTPQEFISAAKYGYLYQGQPYVWQEAPRGAPSFGIAPEAFVCFIENHDQVANSATAQRVRHQTSPGRYRAMTALLLLGPWTPMLFQGQEFGATTPFAYFTDVGDDKLKQAIREGRFNFLKQFPSVMDAHMEKRLPDPCDPETVARCTLDFSERESQASFYRLHVDLMKLRQSDSRFREQIPGGVDGAVLGRESFVLRYFSSANDDDRLLIVNFGKQLALSPAPEPLLAPPLGFVWETLWSSEAPRYGGPGETTVAAENNWMLPAEGAVALRLVPEKAPRKKPTRRRVNG